MFQTKEQDKTPEYELNKVQISNLFENEFKVMIAKMFKEQRERLDELSEKLDVSQDGRIRGPEFTSPHKYIKNTSTNEEFSLSTC